MRFEGRRRTEMSFCKMDSSATSRKISPSSSSRSVFLSVFSMLILMMLWQLPSTEATTLGTGDETGDASSVSILKNGDNYNKAEIASSISISERRKGLGYGDTKAEMSTTSMSERRKGLGYGDDTGDDSSVSTLKKGDNYNKDKMASSISMSERSKGLGYGETNSEMSSSMAMSERSKGLGYGDETGDDSSVSILNKGDNYNKEEMASSTSMSERSKGFGYGETNSEMSSSMAMSERRKGLGYGDTIPAAPVQGQATSCSLDLSDQLLGGVKVACMMGELDRRHCCPVLAAWLMAARAKVALHPPLPQQPGMPLLPDDSLVCIASLKAALFARGITLTPPNSTCDVVTCFCGIKLNHITSQSCPLPFSNGNGDGHNSSSASATYEPTTIIPNPVINVSTVEIGPIETSPVEFSPHRHDIIPSKALPLEPTTNASASSGPSPSTAKMNTTGSISTKSNMSDLLQALASNCSDHSYMGCTRCLRTLRKEVSNSSAKKLGVTGSTAKTLNCEMIGLMWLLHMNKTFYIPTVSAVVRALVYNDHKCSPDIENMPLALDYSEILAKSNNGSSSKISISSSHQALLLLFLLVIFTSTFLNHHSCI